MTPERSTARAGGPPNSQAGGRRSSEDCAAFSERLLADIAISCQDRAEWPSRLLAGIEAVLAYLGEEPEVGGQVVTLDAATAGPAGLACRDRLMPRLAGLLRQARSYYPKAETLPVDTERLLVEGLRAVLAERVRDGLHDQAALAAELAEMALAPYLGPAQSQRAIESELRRRARRGGPAPPRKALTGRLVPPEEVAEDQRRRLYTAMVDEVLDVGLGRASVLRVANRAEVSKATFYQHFDDKRDCLRGAHAATEERLRARIAIALAPESAWPARVRAALAAILRFLATSPSTLYLLTLEGSASDPSLAARNQALARELAAALRRGRRYRPEGDSLPRTYEAALIQRAALSARERVLGGGADSLPDLADQLTELILTPYLGTEEAKRVVAASG